MILSHKNMNPSFKPVDQTGKVKFKVPSWVIHLSFDNICLSLPVYPYILQWPYLCNLSRWDLFLSVNLKNSKILTVLSVVNVVIQF